ncbi:MAG: NAD(P)/FAD-dependent oxidoreductase [Pseudomonadota bacterium]
MNGQPLPKEVDAAVIGAGPAGMAAALTLSRALQRTLVLDRTTTYRNRDSAGIGAVLGRDGLMPDDLRGLGRQEIEAYGYARFHDEGLAAITGKQAEGFLLETETGEKLRAKAVLLACGMVDIFPEVPGLSSFWGSSIINCPFCHGFELRGLPWGIFVDRPEMLAAAEIYETWTSDLIFFLQPGQELTPEREAELRQRGYGLERRPVHRFAGDDTGLQAVVLEDGSEIARNGLVLWPRQRQTDLVTSLGLPLDEQGCVTVDEGFRTALPGIYAAGDLLYLGHQNVNTAIHMGNLAASTLVFDLAQGAR